MPQTDKERTYLCPDCTEPVQVTTKVCPSCGCAFDTEEYECMICGTTVTSESDECLACGTEFVGREHPMLRVPARSLVPDTDSRELRKEWLRKSHDDTE